MSRAVIKQKGTEILVGTKVDPAKCPRCSNRLVRDVIDIGLTEFKCACGYNGRDRDGSLKAAMQSREQKEPKRPSRAPWFWIFD